MKSSLHTIDVLSVGHASYDIIMKVDHHPDADEKCFAQDFTQSGGGPAANAAVAVARLGGKSAFVGYLGNDIYGSQHLYELNQMGVMTDWVVRDKHPSPLSVVLVKSDGSRTVVNYKQRTPHLKKEHFQISQIRPAAMLFDGHEPLISAPLVEFAQKQAIPIILDAGSVHRGTKELSKSVDYLVASIKFARDFTGRSMPVEALKKLSYLAPTVVITLGENGVLWSSRDGKQQIFGQLPAYSVTVVDTTGAGDTFHGAFALGVAYGYQLDHLLKFASATAALKCTKLGSRKGIPNKQEVERFLNENELNSIELNL